MAKKIENRIATENDRDWYQQFLKVGHEAGISPHTNALLRMIEPKLSMMLLFEFKNSSPIDDLKPEIYKTIISSIVRISESATQREDFIDPFLTNLQEFTHNNQKEQIDILEQILAVAPNHRSALWLLGGVYETMPDMLKKVKK